MNTINLREIITTLLKHWHWFAVSVVACVIIAFCYLRTQPDVYEVETGILLRQSDKLNGPIDKMAMLEAIGFSGASKEVLDEIEIMSSKTLTTAMIDTLGIANEYYVRSGWQWKELYQHTPFILLADSNNFNSTITSTFTLTIRKSGEKFKIEIQNIAQKKTVEIATVSEQFEAFGYKFRLAITGKQFDQTAKYRIVANKKNDLVDELNKDITILQTSKRSNAIKMRTESACPDKAIDELNTLIYLYNADAVADKNLIAQNTKNFIDKRIKLIENDLFDVERIEEQYKKSNDLTDLETDAKLYLQLGSDYERSRVTLQSQLGMINFLTDYLKDESNPYGLLPTGIIIDSPQGKTTSVLNDKDKFQTSGGLIPSGTGINDPALSAMIKEYNDLALNRMKLVRSTNENNPTVTELTQHLKILKSNIFSSIASTQKGIEISLNDVIAKDNLFKSKIKNVPTQAREYREIERQQKIKETLYLFLLEKQEEMALSLASTVPSAKTLDKAYASSSPVAPRRMIILFTALLAGLLFPIMVLYTKDLLNNKVGNRSELKKLIDVPILGTIAETKNVEQVVVLPNEVTAIAEQFRLVRSNLQFMMMGKSTPHVILVTSSVSGEGKTFCAINLAMSLALTKQKTILLGMDIRNPKLGEYLNIDTKTGISLFLSDSTCQLDEVIHHSDNTPNLDIIPCGPIPPNPAELLMGERTDILFEQLKEKYDYIVVDSAPVGLVSDTYILNKNVDLSVYIVRCNYTPKDILANLKEIYDNKKLTNVAVLLNGDSEQDTYGYGKYYRTHKR